MRFHRPAFVAAAILAAGSAVLAATPTADDLIARHLAARGGTDKLSAIRSLRFEGTRTRAGGGSEMSFVEVRTRDGAFRSDVTMQGLTNTRATDGKSGWAVQAFRGRKDPEQLSADAVKEMAYEADFDGPLVNYRAKGSEVTFLGTEDVDGTDAHKLKVSRPNGDVDYVYLDPDYFLEIRRLSLHRIRGTEVESETDFGEYERVNGVYFPFSIEVGARGSTNKFQKISITKVEANAAVDDASFRVVEAPPAAK